MKRNCLSGCAHYKTEEVIVKKDVGGFVLNEFQGYSHRCDKCPLVYEKWWEDNKHKKADESEELECYEPNEIQASLNNMISIAEEILSKTRE